MKFFGLRSAAILAAPLFLSLSEVARAADAATEDAVMVLTADTIEQAIKDNSHLVVEFYAPCEWSSQDIVSPAAPTSKDILRAFVLSVFAAFFPAVCSCSFSRPFLLSEAT